MRTLRCYRAVMPVTPSVGDALHFRAVCGLWGLEDEISVFVTRGHVVANAGAVDVIQVNRYEVAVDQRNHDWI